MQHNTTFLRNDSLQNSALRMSSGNAHALSRLSRLASLITYAAAILALAALAGVLFSPLSSGQKACDVEPTSPGGDAQRNLLERSGRLLASVLAQAPHTGGYYAEASAWAATQELFESLASVAESDAKSAFVFRKTAEDAQNGNAENAAKSDVSGSRKNQAAKSASAALGEAGASGFDSSALATWADMLQNVAQVLDTAVRLPRAKPEDRFGVYEGEAARAGTFLNTLYPSLDTKCYYILWQGTRDVCSPLTPDTSGLDFAELADADGVLFVKKLHEAAQSGGGFVTFRQFADSDGTPAPQGVTFLAYVAPLGHDELYLSMWLPLEVSRGVQQGDGVETGKASRCGGAVLCTGFAIFAGGLFILGRLLGRIARQVSGALPRPALCSVQPTPLSTRKSADERTTGHAQPIKREPLVLSKRDAREPEKNDPAGGEERPVIRRK